MSKRFEQKQEEFRQVWNTNYELSNLCRLRRVMSCDDKHKGLFIKPIKSHGSKKTLYQLRDSSFDLDLRRNIETLMNEIWPHEKFKYTYTWYAWVLKQNDRDNRKIKQKYQEYKHRADHGDKEAEKYMPKRILPQYRQDIGAMTWKHIPGSESVQGIGRGRGRQASFSLGF